MTERDEPRAAPTAIVAFAALVVLIGSNLVAIRIGNRELAPLWHAGLRFLIVAILFVAIALLRRAPRPSAPAAAAPRSTGRC